MKNIILNIFLCCLTHFIFSPPLYAHNHMNIPARYSMPLSFTINNGQSDGVVKFSSKINECELLFSRNSIAIISPFPEENARNSGVVQSIEIIPQARTTSQKKFHALQISMEGADNDPVITGEGRLPWDNNYFIGSDPSCWRTHVANYSKIRYHDIYPGIDLVYYGEQCSLKYDFIIQPGIDPGQIVLSYSGASGIRLTNAGDMEITAANGSILEKKPVCYQIIKGRKEELFGAFRILDLESCCFSFDISGYNPSYPLVIDPELAFSTFLGSSLYDECRGLTVDEAGNIYLTGLSSSEYGFPVTPGVYFTGSGGAFITKMNASGTAILFSTFISGFGSRGIKVDAKGNIFVAGSSIYVSNNPKFPITPGAYRPDFIGDDENLYAAKLNSLGDSLLYGACIGGSADDRAQFMDIDSEGNVCIAGYTNSRDYPVTPNALQKNHTGSSLHVCKLSAEGNRLLYATYFGGSSSSEYFHGLAVDKTGNAYLIGNTESSDFPITPGCLDSTLSHNTGEVSSPNGFVSKIDATGSRLIYSTFLFHADPWAITIDSLNHAYIAGKWLRVQNFIFPTTSGAYQPDYLADDDATVLDTFLCKLSPDGNTFVFSTFLFRAWIEGIALDRKNNIYITGNPVFINHGSFPTTPDAYARTGNSGNIYLSKISASGSELLYSTYFGGSNGEYSRGIAIGGQNNVYIAGITNSKDFPTTDGVFDRTKNSEGDLFICKFSFGPDPLKVDDTPQSFRLVPPHPNPFNPSTIISFSLHAPGHASLVIYDITGRKVRVLVSGQMSAGEHSVTWDGRDDAGKPAASGVYISRIAAGERVATGKMVLLK